MIRNYSTTIPEGKKRVHVLFQRAACRNFIFRNKSNFKFLLLYLLLYYQTTVHAIRATILSGCFTTFFLTPDNVDLKMKFYWKEIKPVSVVGKTKLFEHNNCIIIVDSEKGGETLALWLSWIMSVAMLVQFHPCDFGIWIWFLFVWESSMKTIYLTETYIFHR